VPRSCSGRWVAGPAEAKGGDVTRSGACSARSIWKLKLAPRAGVIESEFEVDSNVNGQTWNARVSDNGVRVFTGKRTTIAPSGSFSLHLRTANRAGTDRFVAVASNPVGRETCTAAASV
jgi:hypothetical protein